MWNKQKRWVYWDFHLQVKLNVKTSKYSSHYQNQVFQFHCKNSQNKLSLKKLRYNCAISSEIIL